MQVFEQKKKPAPPRPIAKPIAAAAPVTETKASAPKLLPIPDEVRQPLGTPSLLRTIADKYTAATTKFGAWLIGTGALFTSMARTAATACRPAMTNPTLLTLGVALIAVGIAVLGYLLFTR